MVDIREGAGLNLRNHLALERWTLLGHSAGAVLAMHYARCCPSRVDKLVLVASGPIATRDGGAQMDNMMMRLPPETAGRLKQPGLSPGEELRIVIPGFFFDRVKGAEMAAAFRPESLHREVTDLMIKELLPPEGDLRPALRGFERPGLVITGRQDPLDPVVQYESRVIRPKPPRRLDTVNPGHLPSNSHAA